MVPSIWHMPIFSCVLQVLLALSVGIPLLTISIVLSLAIFFGAWGAINGSKDN